MLKRRTKGVLAMLMSVLLMAGIVLPLTACSRKKDSIVIMTEELSGLFNPFYATSGTDMDVVGMTQIGMLGTDKEGNPVAGDDESTVVKAFDYVINGSGEDAKTVYTFVIKNGLKFSDGKPLTMNDVMFNIYEYLDPVYTGSSTMYSIDIEGLSRYRTQTNQSGDDGESESQISSQAAGMALVRILEMVNIYEVNGQLSSSSTSYSLTEEEMRAAINGWMCRMGIRTQSPPKRRRRPGSRMTTANSCSPITTPPSKPSKRSWSPTTSRRSSLTTRPPLPGRTGKIRSTTTSSSSSCMRATSPPSTRK